MCGGQYDTLQKEKFLYELCIYKKKYDKNLQTNITWLLSWWVTVYDSQNVHYNTDWGYPGRLRRKKVSKIKNVFLMLYSCIVCIFFLM